MTNLSHSPTKINGKSEHVPVEWLEQNTPSTLASIITHKQPAPFRGNDGEEWHRDCKYQAFKYKTSFKIWPIQDQAFKDIDQLLSHTEATSSTAALTHLNILWSKEPRLFALEYNNEGKRKYISAHLGRFINFYWRECNAKDRHYYELIREKNPCRLYFDIEYNKMANPGIDDDTNEILIKEFIEELEIEVKDRFNLLIGRSDIVDLDSSTEKKFSRHLIVHMPNGELFEDAVHCGKFVKTIIGRLAEEVATNILEKKGRSTLSNHLFMFAKEASVSHERDNQRSKTCFVDTGVYTRNRIFRILGSRKFGKKTSASLRIALQNEFPFPETFTNECFYEEDIQNDGNDDEVASHGEHQKKIDWHVYAKALVDTLVIPCDEGRNAAILNVNDPNQQTLENGAPRADPSTCTSMRNPKLESNVKSRSFANSTGRSPFPVLDKFADDKLANWKGINGSVRAWSMNDQTHLSSATITYQIKDNRWCENVQRCHKSNNVMWHVSLSEYQYWQSCFDPDCRMSSFGGKRLDLPRDVKTAISEDLISQEVQVSESFEKALLDLSVDERSGNKNKDPYTECDDSFERALMNLNLSGTEVSDDVNAANNEEGSDEIHSSFLVDADFEKALMGLNLDDGNEVST